MMPRIVIFAGLLSMSCVSRRQDKQRNELTNVDTVASLDLEAFLGRWYQMYGSYSSTIMTLISAGPQNLCVSADYALNEDGITIDVLNQGIRPDGNVTKLWGTAKATDEPGKRKIRFSKVVRGDKEKKKPDFDLHYWIYKLGPIVHGSYSYAVVGGLLMPEVGADKTHLFVLARDPNTWTDSYDEEVQEWLDVNGFNRWWNKPRKTGSVGDFYWSPWPAFEKSTDNYGPFGQTGCAYDKRLTRPVDGTRDVRVN